MRILKWTLELVDRQTIQVPEYAQVLSVQVQGANVSLWMHCNEAHELVDFDVAMHATGQDIPASVSDIFDYLGTVQLCDGKIVYHFYGWFAQ
jgi:hypothetical protein